MVHRLSDLRRHARLLGLLCLLLGLVGAAPQVLADSSNYGMGTYGSCAYNTCGISLSSSGTVNLNITPGASVSCTVASDTVSVLTDSSSGYTLTLIDSDTSNQLMSGSDTIAPTTGNTTTPVVLSGGKWGYRVDAVSGFGSGPTSGQSSATAPSLGFAAIPVSTGSPDTITSTTTAADPAVATSVWFGACAQNTQPSGTYTDTVTYTAVVN